MTMTTKELLALVGKATPGPWKLCDGPEGFEHRVYMDEFNLTVAEVVRTTDARLIVAAVNALPALCAEVEALRKDAERYRWMVAQGAEVRPMCSVQFITENGWRNTSGRSLDAAIDAAKEPK